MLLDEFAQNVGYVIKKNQIFTRIKTNINQGYKTNGKS